MNPYRSIVKIYIRNYGGARGTETARKQIVCSGQLNWKLEERIKANQHTHTHTVALFSNEIVVRWSVGWTDGSAVWVVNSNNDDGKTCDGIATQCIC